MGCYINPSNETKEAFLAREGTPINVTEAVILDDQLPVCLVNNGFFKAAGVAFSQAEFEAFASPDGRPKQWYMVPVTKLLQVSDLEHYTRIQ